MHFLFDENYFYAKIILNKEIFMGYLIVVEGTDGSGKKTQVEKLYDKLISIGYNVKRHSFPNYNSLSSRIDNLWRSL